MRSIFVVDEEENIRFIVSEYLMREGFKVETFSSREEVMLRLRMGFPDMFILNLLPAREWWELCREIKLESGIPSIFIIPREEKISEILGFELEGDEYLHKPFSPRELVARVFSTFRRCALPVIPEKALELGNLVIDSNDRHVMVNNKEIRLTPKEYELLLLLAKQPQRTFNRQELLDRLWGYDYVGDDRAVDDLIKRLRRKLRHNGATKNVLTVWGYGYRFEQ